MEDVSMYEKCIYFNLATLNRKVTKVWRDEFSVLGLSPSHGYLLAAMAEKPMSTQKELSEIMELDASTITRFIDVLSSKKLIEKQSTGKGAKFILTSQGLLIANKANDLMDTLFSNMQNTLGKAELATFVNNIKQAKQMLEET